MPRIEGRTRGDSVEVDERTRTQLADAFEAFCPSREQILMPAGYRDSALALVDAVFSMQARYEGARRVVANYAAWAGLQDTPGLPSDIAVADQHSVVDLHDGLICMPPEDLADRVFNNRTRSARAGPLKAELVVEAARSLIEAEVRSRGDITRWPTEPGYAEQKKAWTGIHGLGPVTFEYFRMLCGAESSKPDIMVVGWLEETLGDRPDTAQALEFVAALADELSARWDTTTSQRGVDHTIWRYHSGRGLDPDAPLGSNA